MSRDLLKTEPPQADEAETYLVAGWLEGQDGFLETRDVVQPEHFRQGPMAAIARACESTYANGLPWGPETIAREAARIGVADRVREALPNQPTAVAALLALAAQGSAIQCVVYAPLVVDAAIRRQAFYGASALLDDAHAGNATASDLADRTRELADTLERGYALPATGKAADLTAQAFHELANPPSEAEGSLAWGIPTLDRIGARIERGNYDVLAAMTGGGKTTLAFQTAFGIAERTGNPVLYCSLEMRPQEIVRRAIIARSRVPRAVDRTPTEADVDAWAKAQAEVAALPVYLPSIAHRTIKDFLRWLSATCRKTRFCAVFIDHIGCLQGRARDLYTGTTEVSQALRQWSLRGSETPIVALAQLRRVERKNDGASRPPELFDLKDSGSIENDATSVLMIDRPWIRASTEDRQAGKVQDSDAAIYLKKNRNGATHRKVAIHFDGPCFRMTEAVQERRPWAPNKPGDPRD